MTPLHLDPSNVVVLVAAAAGAGAVNSIAGGGTLISFPMLIAFGLDPIVANATNSIALTPGGFGAAYSYRRELRKDAKVVKLLGPPALVGGLLGAVLLLVTPAKIFGALVPLLVLFATALLFYQNLKSSKARAAGGEWQLPEHTSTSVVLQFLVGLYGGYFGAGQGIMMLAILTRLGGADIHRMNGVKSLLGAAINGVTCVAFFAAHKVDLPVAAIMAIGAIAGGAGGAAIARKIDPKKARWVVVAIGVLITAALAYKTYARGS